MRIAIVYDAIYPYVTGGAERRYDAIARRLVARGHDVTLVGWQYWVGSPVCRTDGGVTLHGVGRPAALHDGAGRRTFREAAAFTARCAPVLARIDVDVIECSSIPYLPALAAAPIARVRGVPLVVSWHEYMGNRWDAYAAAGRTRGRAGIARGVERTAARAGDLRIAVSDFTRDRLPWGPRTIVINNGVDTRAIDAVTAEPSADVAVVGRLVPHKRVHLLLEALRFEPTVTAVVIGDGPERERLMATTREMGIEARVAFTGCIESDARVTSLIKGARCVLVTSEQEGFGMATVEAMAAGVPPIVVASEHSAAGDLVRDGVDGLITDAEPRNIAAAIGRVVNDNALCERLGTRARESARAYDWDAITDQIEHAFGELAGTPVAVRRVATEVIDDRAA